MVLDRIAYVSQNGSCEDGQDELPRLSSDVALSVDVVNKQLRRGVRIVI